MKRAKPAKAWGIVLNGYFVCSGDGCPLIYAKKSHAIPDLCDNQWRVARVEIRECLPKRRKR